MDVVCAKAFELRAEVIDADDENVGLRECRLEKKETCDEAAEECQHGRENRSLRQNDDSFLQLQAEDEGRLAYVHSNSVHLTKSLPRANSGYPDGAEPCHSQIILLSRSLL